MCEMALLMPEKTLEKYDPIEGAAKIAKLNDEQIRKLNRAIELWELEQKGRLLVLPCKVGDSWFAVDWVCHAPPLEEDCDSFEFCRECRYGEGKIREMRFLSTLQIHEKMRYFGKTVFLTCEEAEAALKGGAESVT